jgi:hypothetical protein
VAESLKVPKERFEAVIRNLLRTPPMPLTDIPRKREPNQMNGPSSDKGLGGKRKPKPLPPGGLGAKRKPKVPPLPPGSQGPSLAKRPHPQLSKTPRKRI